MHLANQCGQRPCTAGIVILLAPVVRLGSLVDAGGCADDRCGGRAALVTWGDWMVKEDLLWWGKVPFAIALLFLRWARGGHSTQEP